MKLELITLAGVKVDREVYEVILPTTSGEIAVFPDHEPIVSVAAPGVIRVRYEKKDNDDQMELFAVSGGVIEVNSGLVRVLVDEAEHGDDIIEAESREALARAIEMRDNATDQIELEKAHQLVDRHMVRIKVADLKRRRRKL